MKCIQGAIMAFLISLFFTSFAYASYQHAPPRERLPLTLLTPSSPAITFEQVTFHLEVGTIRNSDWGQFKIRPDQLYDRYGAPLGTGYINVFLNGRRQGGSWVINNLFIPPAPEQHKRHRQHNRYTGSPSNSSSAVVASYFDLRPGQTGRGMKKRVNATVLFSPQPLPTIIDIALLAQRFPSSRFTVLPAHINAEGAGEVDGRMRTTPSRSSVPRSLALGFPPQAIEPSSTLPDDLLFPIQVIQASDQNLDAARNQCVPMANANALQYLEDRYDNLPLVWRLPELHIRGIGRIGAAGDVLFWEPIPENSLVANVDTFGRRNGVHDLDSGSYTSLCGLIRGVLGYLTQSGDQAITTVRHQGSGSLELGDNGADCDTETMLLGGMVSVRDGIEPTWEWMFEQLQLGRAVTIIYSWYDFQGEWQGGHSVRVYGASEFDGRRYIYTLDDADQGDNFSNVSDPRKQQWEVADTGSPGLLGVPNGRLNMDGMNWEITFALSLEAKPTLVIP